MSAKNTVCVVSPDGVLSNALKAPLKSAALNQIVCESVKEFLETYDEDKPIGCVVADIRVGADVLKDLAQGNLVLPVVLYGPGVSASATVQAVKAGAFDVADKMDALVDGLKKATSAYAKYQKLFEERQQASERIQSLTRRETQVLNLMVQGIPNRQIAEELGISTKTLDIHRSNLMDKMAARTAAGLYRAYLLDTTNPAFLPILFG